MHSPWKRGTPPYPQTNEFFGAVMAKEFDDQYADKHSIVNELFIATADDNYIAARWCFHQNLNVDFFWLAVHCVEKYLKASLLLNGKNVKKQSHDIVKMFPAVKALAPELLPTTLTKPDNNMPDRFWRTETIDAFVERLYRDGQAHNRYQLYGYVRHAEDLFKLDQLVFHVRRLCQPLEVHFLGEPRDGVPDQSKRQRMKDHPTFWNLSCKLEETMDGKRGETLRHALLNWNFPFIGDSYPHVETSYVYVSQNPVLVRRLYDPLDAGPAHFQESDDLWSWVTTNIFLPQSLIADIERDRAALKAKASAKAQ
jgi:hypothetical protein